MRVVILTSSFHGLASYCIPFLMRESEIEIAMIIYNEEQVLNAQKERKRKIRKVFKIGVLGAINGIRMRRWFGEDAIGYLNIERLDIVAKKFGIPLERTPSMNCQRTIDLFNEANSELGLSLGNGYIGRCIFSIPKYGMINIHHEILPQFQGAQSIIWQIYEGSSETGYAIHQIDSHIDTGDIIYQERMPIELKPTLHETVSYNYARLYEASVKGLVKVIKNYNGFKIKAKEQIGGRTFTTPSFWQYVRMFYNHKKLYKECSLKKAGKGNAGPILSS